MCTPHRGQLVTSRALVTPMHVLADGVPAGSFISVDTIAAAPRERSCFDFARSAFDCLKAMLGYAGHRHSRGWLNTNPVVTPLFNSAARPNDVVTRR